MAFFKELMLRC